MVATAKYCTRELFWIFQTLAELPLEYTIVQPTMELEMQFATNLKWMLYVSSYRPYTLSFHIDYVRLILSRNKNAQIQPQK